MISTQFHSSHLDSCNIFLQTDLFVSKELRKKSATQRFFMVWQINQISDAIFCKVVIELTRNINVSVTFETPKQQTGISQSLTTSPRLKANPRVLATLNH